MEVAHAILTPSHGVYTSFFRQAPQNSIWTNVLVDVAQVMLIPSHSEYAFLLLQGCVIRSFETFNTVKYALHTLERIIRIRHLTHPCFFMSITTKTVFGLTCWPYDTSLFFRQSPPKLSLDLRAVGGGP